MSSNTIIIGDDDKDVIILSDDENDELGVIRQGSSSPITPPVNCQSKVANLSVNISHDLTRNTTINRTKARHQEELAIPNWHSYSIGGSNRFDYESYLFSEKTTKAKARKAVRNTVCLEDGLIDLETLEDEDSDIHKMSGLIDLEDFEDEDSSIREKTPNSLVLRLDDIYSVERKSSVDCQKSLFNHTQRNPPIVKPLERCRQVKHNNMLLKPFRTVELQDGDFLRIKDIVRNSQTGEITLRGHRLQRTRDLNGALVKKLNELCIFFEIDLDDPRQPDEQCAVEIPLTDLLRFRQLRQTNQLFPNCRDIKGFADADDAAIQGKLTVRWKYTCKYASALDRHRNIWVERTIEHIRQEESENCYAVSDTDCLFNWRGETIPGGAYRPTVNGERKKGSIIVEIDGSYLHANVLKAVNWGSSSDVIGTDDPVARKRKFTTFINASNSGATWKRGDEAARRDLSRIPLADNGLPRKLSCVTEFSSLKLGELPPDGALRSTRWIAQRPIVRSEGQKYTYGDAFCGAGGSTRGADMAGLLVKWGCDFWDPACSTWHANFPYATCYKMASHVFVAEAIDKPDDVQVDILHLSPPCQFFSPAHTVSGKDDEMNVASLFAVNAIIKAVRPRIITLEQTFGICVPKFRYYFNALIQQFSSLDLSVRWAIIPLSQWGLPQRRHRLIIVASCPGEILPKIPAFTHSQDGEGGLKPFATVNKILREVEENLSRERRQDPKLDSATRYDPPKVPYDGDKVLPRAMTTHGGQNYHPSGKRDLTLREYAAMQGFPPHHVFRGSYIKKQIGNAVPPSVGKVLFRSIIKELDEADGVENPPSEEL